MCKCTPNMRTPFCGVGDCIDIFDVSSTGFDNIKLPKDHDQEPKNYSKHCLGDDCMKPHAFTIKVSVKEKDSGASASWIMRGCKEHCLRAFEAKASSIDDLFPIEEIKK